jgi:hypothetical protein
MNNFLKELMTLATELNKVEGFNALTVINDMELLYERHVTELKNLAIHDVSNRRELYFAFMKEYNALMGESEHQILKEEVEVLLVKYSC